MALVTILTFNPFAENTYIVAAGEGGPCILFDPGCYTPEEEDLLASTLAAGGWQPQRLINTHAHIDHIYGNGWVWKTFGLLPEMHRDELPVWQAAPQVAALYGVPMAGETPAPEAFIAPDQWIECGDIRLQALYTPGHSPASLSFYCPEEGFLIGGDVLFRESIGRTDLPGGDYDTLLRSIREQLYTLPDDTRVYPGHGPETTIGYEKKHNPFIQG